MGAAQRLRVGTEDGAETLRARAHRRGKADTLIAFNDAEGFANNYEQALEIEAEDQTCDGQNDRHRMNVDAGRGMGRV